jgi:hypothetical protein
MWMSGAAAWMGKVIEGCTLTKGQHVERKKREGEKKGRRVTDVEVLQEVGENISFVIEETEKDEEVSERMERKRRRRTSQHSSMEIRPMGVETTSNSCRVPSLHRALSEPDGRNLCL